MKVLIRLCLVLSIFMIIGCQDSEIPPSNQKVGNVFVNTPLEELEMALLTRNWTYIERVVKDVTADDFNNIRGSDGSSILFIAAREFPVSVLLLAENGADPFFAQDSEVPIVQIVRQKNYVGVTKALIASQDYDRRFVRIHNGQEYEMSVLDAMIQSADDRMIEVFIQRGVTLPDSLVVDGKRVSTLMWAVDNLAVPLVRDILYCYGACQELRENRNRSHATLKLVDLINTKASQVSSDEEIEKVRTIQRLFDLCLGV